VVRQHRGTSVMVLSAGGRAIRIPTEHPEQVQSAVDRYITHKSYYNVVTNDCAEFVNHVLNEAQDIKISGSPYPKHYFSELEKLYPDCAVR
jgi:hypothetical protein